MTHQDSGAVGTEVLARVAASVDVLSPPPATLRSAERTRGSQPTTTEWERGRPGRVVEFVDFTSRPKVVVQEGLNGVRGLAVIVVVAFHLGYTEVLGGAQLVMSLFFTQSGFLIATLILHEYDRTGRFRLGPFWAARARRILPPAWLTLAAVGVLRVATNAFDIPNPVDMLTALLHVNNWYLYFSDAITDAIAADRSSELNHMWSLGVEEQFYVVIALVGVLIVATAARPLVWLRWIALGGAAISFALPFVFDFGEERVFYGTDARAGELLTGVAMATFLISRPLREAMVRASWLMAVAAMCGFGVAIVLWHEARPRTGMLENGLLPVGSLLWVLVIVGAMMPDGPVAWLTRLRLLRWLGVLSYGIYIYHFPILSFVHHHLDDIHPMLLSIIVVALTLAVSVASLRFVEMPIRRRKIIGRPLALGGAAVMAIIFGSMALQ